MKPEKVTFKLKDQKSIEELLKKARLPAVPKVLHEIMQLTQKSNATSQAVADLVKREPGLSAHLLKLVNSAHYGLRGKVSSLSHAVMLVGFSNIRSVAASLLLLERMNKECGIPIRFLSQIWLHNVVCASLCEIVGKRVLSKEEQDLLFISALVHDMGHLILLQVFYDEYSKTLDQFGLPKIQDEEKNYGVHHAFIGAKFLESWNYPLDILNIVAFHHDVGQFPGNPVLLKVFRFCDTVSENWEIIEPWLMQPEKGVEKEQLKILSELGWKWEEVQKFIPEIEKSLGIAKEILESLGGEDLLERSA